MIMTCCSVQVIDGVVVVDDVLDHLHPARPQFLTEHVTDVAGGVPQVWIGRRIEQVGRNSERGQSGSHCAREG
jgi:hypothetical protein